MYSTAKKITSRGLDNLLEKVSSSRCLLNTNKIRVPGFKENKKEIDIIQINELNQDFHSSFNDIEKIIQRISSSNAFLKSEIKKVYLKRHYLILSKQT